MSIYVNRILNMKKIKAIGFDMDYTLVRYKTEHFEKFTHEQVLKKLVQVKNYPKEIQDLQFDFQKVIQGLVVDKKRGNLLKVSRFGKVKVCCHGTKPMDFKKQQKIYGNRVIDLSDEWVQSLDTSFSTSNGIIYAQLVDMKDQGFDIPDYSVLADEVKEVLDLAHSDGTLKDQVRERLDDFIIQDPKVAEVLERFKRYGKKLWVITNSDYRYTRLLLDHTITPFLKDHKCWTELFDITITLSSKPRFFTTRNSFLEIDSKTGLMSNSEGKVEEGRIYQGGFAGKLQEDLGLEGDEILYLGDHIYGDVVSIKKTFNWRTALVLEPLSEEVDAVKRSQPIQLEIDILMDEKEKLERELNDLDAQKHENNAKPDRDKINRLFAEIDKINTQISDKLSLYKDYFNPYWGEMMRAGQEESRFADQVEKYACVYMAKVGDLLEYSPKTYFRPRKRVLPHESFE